MWWNVGPYEAVRMRRSVWGGPYGNIRTGILKSWLADSSVTWISHIITPDTKLYGLYRIHFRTTCWCGAEMYRIDCWSTAYRIHAGSYKRNPNPIWKGIRYIGDPVSCKQGLSLRKTVEKVSPIPVTLTSRSDSDFEWSNISLKENARDGVDSNS